MMQSTGVILILFLSTLSLRRATRLCTILYSCPGNFYPRSPCGERPFIQIKDTPKTNFYPRSPCGERRNNRQATVHTWKFLSTLSLRRATLHCNTPNVLRHYFYPRSPCGERHLINAGGFCFCGISIHALLAESDY